MTGRSTLKVWLYIDILILFAAITYKLYLIAFETDFYSLNINNINEAQKIEKDADSFSFAVIGNIKNSIDIFDARLAEKINNDKPDFMISTGNAVWDGGEDKYRILNKSLKKVTVPEIMGIGDNEVSDGGTLRFYRHFGPLYFSFTIGDTCFIFLDTTGKTTEAWQRKWLSGELVNSQSFKNRFIFMNRPIYKIDGSYIKSPSYRKFLTDNFVKYNVTAVFSAGAEIYDHRHVKGIPCYISGGGGGRLLLNSRDSYYHYVKVDVTPDNVRCTVIKQGKPLAFLQFLSNLWVYIHSLFYINFINFVLGLSVLILAGIIIYIRITREVDYYRSFDEDAAEAFGDEKYNIAMFTNNYHPFVGGVPVSIDRLTKGLKNCGHKVYIFAPDYPEAYPDEKDTVIRCKLLKYHKTRYFNFPIVNIFSRNIEKEFSSRHIDVVHVHHPYWMGAKGVKLAQKYNIPVVLTYHTRLDKYAHYLPVLLRELFKNHVSHYLVKRFSKKCDAIFAPADTIKEYLRNIGVNRSIEILPTGVNFADYNFMAPHDIDKLRQNYNICDELILCCVSRLAKEKNLDFLLEGVKYIKEQTDIPFKLLLIGEGPERENISKAITANNLEGMVVLTGRIDTEDIYNYYIMSDIFIFTSRSETQGIVILEAMAGRCPVVAVRSSGIDDIVRNGYNGYKTKADIQAWAGKIIYLMENPDSRLEMSQNARAFSGSYAVEQMAVRAAKVYSRAIQNKKAELFDGKGCKNDKTYGVDSQ